MPEEIGTLLDSYVKVLRTHATMDFSQSCERDWKNLETLLVEQPEFAERTISYLVNALQDAAEKRVTSRAEQNARSSRKGASVIKAVDHDGKVGFQYVVVDECVPVIKDFICGLEGAGNRAVWHREHGWLPSALHKLAELREFESDGPYGGFGLADLSPADDDVGQEQIAPGTWTTIPDGYEITSGATKAFPYWHDMETESEGLLQRPDGHRSAVCRIRRTREGSYKLGFRSPFTDIFRGRFRPLYPDLDSAKVAAEEIFRSGLELYGLALAS